MNKNLLIVSRQPPYGSSLPREALDVALAAAVYDQNIGILFMDDGVFQLLNKQNPDTISQKNIASTLSALPLYGIENIYVHKQSLESRNLTIEELALDEIKILSTEDVAQLLDQQDHLLSF
jgi:tRNA 2-thiouridine synthesizing protein C